MTLRNEALELLQAGDEEITELRDSAREIETRTNQLSVLVEALRVYDHLSLIDLDSEHGDFADDIQAASGNEAPLESISNQIRALGQDRPTARNIEFDPESHDLDDPFAMYLLGITRRLPMFLHHVVEEFGLYPALVYFLRHSITIRSNGDVRLALRMIQESSQIPDASILSAADILARRLHNEAGIGEHLVLQRLSPFESPTDQNHNPVEQDQSIQVTSVSSFIVTLEYLDRFENELTSHQQNREVETGALQRIMESWVTHRDPGVKERCGRTLDMAFRGQLQYQSILAMIWEEDAESTIVNSRRPLARNSRNVENWNVEAIVNLVKQLNHGTVFMKLMSIYVFRDFLLFDQQKLACSFGFCGHLRQLSRSTHADATIRQVARSAEERFERRLASFGEERIDFASFADGIPDVTLLLEMMNGVDLTQ